MSFTIDVIDGIVHYDQTTDRNDAIDIAKRDIHGW